MNDVKKLLQQVASGEITPEEAEIRLKMKPFEDLGFAKPDIHRALRQGATEVIFGEGKTPEQISAIASELLGSGQETVIITRLSEEKSGKITTPLTYYKNARIGVCGKINPPDTDGAEQALNEIGNFTKNPVIANQALCKAAQILAKSDQEDKRRQALSRFHMVLDFADQTNPENLPWIEQSIAGAVKLHKSLDIDTDLIPKLTATYEKLFPNGELLK